MQGRRALKPAPVELVRASLAVDDRGALVWPLLAPRANPHRGRKAGSLHPDGSTVVSIRRDGVLWTLRAERAAWCVHYGELPVGVVAFRDGDPNNFRRENLYTRARAACSVGLRGGDAAAGARP